MACSRFIKDRNLARDRESSWTFWTPAFCFSSVRMVNAGGRGRGVGPQLVQGRDRLAVQGGVDR
eukprot:scaffold13634_cov108-Isochrysis_galbana.AAC.2